MSIIYKALQKAQENLVNQHNLSPKVIVSPRRSRIVDIVLVGAIAILSLIVFVAYFPKIKNHMPLLSFNKPVVKEVPKVQTPVVIPEVDYQMGDLNLSGVFVSNQERIAMINNQQFHVGQLIKGMKIISIDQSQVKLLDGNVIFIMHVV